MKFATLTVALACSLCLPAYASTISTQTTPAGAAALPALSGGTVIDFESTTLGRYTTLTIAGVTFTPGTATAEYVDNTYAGNYNTFGKSLANTYASDGFSTLTINFSSPVSAFGFFWGASDSAWTLNAYNASNTLLESFVLPITYTSNAGDFVGLVDPGITKATLVDSTTGDYIFIDNFAFKSGQASAVPEPATFGLVGASLMLATFLRRRKS
jgi:PEP-CTERM motif-containing protein